MNLNECEGKIIRVKTKYGETFEGICQYNSKEYTFHEFGINEESIQFPFLLIRKSEIESIESLENHDGPYGKFTEKYGLVEIYAAKEGLIGIEEVLYSEEPKHIYRLLLYLEENLPRYDGLKEMIKDFLIYETDEKIIKKAHKLIEMLERRDKMEEKDCTCGCHEGKECTCEDECTCGEDCTCKNK